MPFTRASTVASSVAVPTALSLAPPSAACSTGAVIPSVVAFSARQFSLEVAPSAGAEALASTPSAAVALPASSVIATVAAAPALAAPPPVALLPFAAATSPSSGLALPGCAQEAGASPAVGTPPTADGLAMSTDWRP